MRVGLLLAVAVVAELVLLVGTARDAIAMARVVLTVALATQTAAVATFVLTRVSSSGRGTRRG